MNPKILAFITDGRKFLALRNNPSEPEIYGGDFWFTVTGGVEKNETHEKAVKREVKEKTSLSAKEIIDLNWGCRYKTRDIENEENYFLTFVSPGKVKLSVEHVDYEWLSIGDFLERISWDENKKELSRILRDALNKIIRPGIYIDDFINRVRIVNIKKIKYILKWHEVDDFSKLPKDKVNGAYCVPFDSKGNILIVDVHRKNEWAIPGGGIEHNENYIETLKRECLEEADMKIKDILPLGYLEIDEVNGKGNKNKTYRVRYFARIAKLNKQTLDPATGVIPIRKLISPDDFAYYCPWGFQIDEMIDKAVKMY